MHYQEAMIDVSAIKLVQAKTLFSRGAFDLFKLHIGWKVCGPKGQYTNFLYACARHRYDAAYGLGEVSKISAYSDENRNMYGTLWLEFGYEFVSLVDTLEKYKQYFNKGVLERETGVPGIERFPVSRRARMANKS